MAYGMTRKRVFCIASRPEIGFFRPLGVIPLGLFEKRDTTCFSIGLCWVDFFFEEMPACTRMCTHTYVRALSTVPTRMYAWVLFTHARA
jgi:hypothetical protein